jgi:AraC family transcriptional regulator of adaptative response / DNA-3-methyladenine glycosylase II
MADKDAAWDGLFFTGVTSTGIYCRPVCRVKLPRQAHCRFFETPAHAESQGFRPCLRCRPELAPARRFWSTTDAQAVLAESAAQHLHSAIQRGAKPPSMTALAARLGVSDRHLRRMFLRHWQVTPLQYLQTQRLLHAKQWLHDSPVTVAQVARASGFGSARRMYAAFAQHYQLSPGQLRPARDPHHNNRGHDQGTTVVLHYRPPYQIDTLCQFLKDRALDGMESWGGVDPEAWDWPSARPTWRRTVRWPHGLGAILGWLELQWDRTRPCVQLRLSPSLLPVLPAVVAQVRDALDLDADPARMAQVLGQDFPEALGQRVPGGLDGFELAVRAVLGQQISVKAARTLGQRLVKALGEPCATPWPELNRTFPSPACLAREENAALMGSLGLVRQRQKAIQALAQAVESGQLPLQALQALQAQQAQDQAQTLSASSVPSTALSALMALPGIGPWTAHYIAMRAWRWADAWPVQDVALQTALGVRQHPRPAQALESMGQAWRPFRSYALVAAWQRLASNSSPEKPSPGKPSPGDPSPLKRHLNHKPKAAPP